LEIVRRNELHRFVVLPKRWLIERTLAWISRSRRLARDFERYTSNRRRLHTSDHDPSHAPTFDQAISLLMIPDFLARL
jgi:transposase